MEKFNPSPEELGLKSLEEQFEKKEKLIINDQEVKVRDIIPKNLEDETPVFIGTGWAEPPEAYKENILTMAECGRRTLAIEASSTHGVKDKEIEENNPDLPKAELRKIAALIKTLEEKQIDKIDAVSHSEAGLYTVLAAFLYPEKFRNIILVDSAGIIGKDSFMGLAKRFSADLLNEAKRGKEDPQLRGTIMKKTIEGAKSIAANPKRSLEEVFAIAKTQISDLLQELREKGIGVGIIHAVDDKAFPMERVQETIKKDMVDGFYSVRGTHNEVMLKPEEYTKLAANALTDIENKKQASISKEEAQ